MIEHIVLLKLKSGVTDEQFQAAVKGWQELRPHIPGLLELLAGRNVSIQPFSKGFTHVVVVRFESATARDTYVTLPLREQFTKEHVLPLIDDVCVVDVSVT